MSNIDVARTGMDAGNVAGDWQPLIERLAEDVRLKVTMPEGTPISSELQAKQAVIDLLMNLGDLLKFQQEKPLEYFGRADRVVALGVESMEIQKTGVTVRGSEYATVLDFRDGQITQFLVIQDTTAFAEAYRED